MPDRELPRAKRSVGAEPSLAGDCRGAVAAEYIVLLATMGLVVALSILGMGPSLVRSFSFTRAVIVSPTP